MSSIFYHQVCCFLSLCCCGSPTTISQGYFVVITSIALVGALIISLGHLKFGNFNCKAKITVSRFDNNYRASSWLINHQIAFLCHSFNLFKSFLGIYLYIYHDDALFYRFCGSIVRTNRIQDRRELLGHTAICRGKLDIMIYSQFYDCLLHIYIS